MQRKQRRKQKVSKKRPKEHPEIRRIEARLGMVQLRDLILVARNMPYRGLRAPKGAYPGAQLTVRQFASTFGVQTSLSNVGGSASPAQLVQNSATTVFFALAFQLSDLPQSGTFSAMFDRYRFERVKVHFKARNNAVFIANTASPNGAVPTGYVVVDRDDSTALTSTSDALQYDNAESFSGTEDFTVEIVPSITPAVFASGAFSGYGTTPSNSMWLDIANTSIPQYGVKGHVAPLTATTSSSWVWDITAEYIVSFAKTR